MSDYKPDYQALSEALHSAGHLFSAAEAQGIMLGMICAGVSDWQSVLAPVHDALRTHLQALWERGVKELREGHTPVYLLLPDEHAPLKVQAQALRDWAQGFLYGFGLAGKQTADFLSSEAGEALRDFSEISRLDVEGVEGEGSEAALTELREYLWVAVELIWHEARQHESK